MPHELATKDLLQEYLLMRIGGIAQRCSDKLYAGEDIPIEVVQVISVVIEEFTDKDSGRQEWNGKDREPVARFLKSYAVLRPELSLSSCSIMVLFCTKSPG